MKLFEEAPKPSPRDSDEKHVYYLRLIAFCDELGISKETFRKYKDDPYSLEGVVVAGIQSLKHRLARCNKAYKQLQLLNFELSQYDIRDIKSEQKEK